MEKSVLGVIVGLIILLGTVSTVALFTAGRTPPGVPVVPSGEATLASDQVVVARLAFENAVLSAAPEDRRVRARTRIAAGYRLVDIGLARVALRAPVDMVVAWDRLRRSGEPVDLELPLGRTAGLVPVGRQEAAGSGVTPGPGFGPGRRGNADADAAPPPDNPLNLWLVPNRETDDGWRAEIGPATIEIAGDRLRVLNAGPVPVDVPVLGPGRWVIFLDADGRLQRIERATSVLD